MGEEQSSAAQAQTEKRTRFVSEIEFPYADLESAVGLAEAIHSHAGASCEDAELAAWLDQSTSSGTYRSRRSAARMFGLIDMAQGKISLTPLGREAVEGRQARVDAFLRPELFRVMYDQYRGQVLPPPPAIERHMSQLGVSPKQTDRARQVFQKSAQYAGYIDAATSRFVRPGNGPDTERTPASTEQRTSGGGGDGPDLDPLIAALIQKLPPAGTTDWPIGDRVMWLQMAAMAFQMAYGPTAPIKIEAADPLPIRSTAPKEAAAE